jgi:hypothetical protein
MRPLDIGEPHLEDVDDLVGLVDGQRGLGEIDHPGGVEHLDLSGLLG